MSKLKAELTPRLACAKIVRILDALPSHERARTLRAVEAMLSLDVMIADELSVRP